MSLAESVTEESERIDFLKSLISQFEPHDSDEDSGIFHALSLLRRALEEDLLKKESCEAIFNGEKPFYSDHFRVFRIPVFGKAYYLARNGDREYSVQARSFFGKKEPFDIYSDCEGLDNLD